MLIKLRWGGKVEGEGWWVVEIKWWVKGNVLLTAIKDIIMFINLSFLLIHLYNLKSNSNPAMEGQGYSKSDFVSESVSRVSILASHVRHDHTYAKLSPKNAGGSGMDLKDGPAGEFGVYASLLIAFF